MTTTFHTAISTGAAANAATINAPLGQLDAKMGVSLDADGTLKAGAVDVAAIFANAALPERNTMYYAPSTSWNASTKVLTITGHWYLIHGNSGKYARGATLTVDFSSFSNFAIAYLDSINRDAVQTTAGSYLHVEDISALSQSLYAYDVYSLAFYNPVTNRCWTVFDDSLGVPPRNSFYSAKGVLWDPLAKILTIPTYWYIFHGSNGNYARGSTLTIDFSAATTDAFAYLTGIDRDKVQSGLSQSNLKIEAFNALTSQLDARDVYIVAQYNSLQGTVVTPFWDAVMQQASMTEQYAGRTRAWQNHYPEANTKLAPFFQKLLTLDDDVRVLMWGDSLLAWTGYVSTTGIDATTLPPCLTARNVAWYIWRNLKANRATYKRYDATTAFTETGTWATSTSGDNTANGGVDAAWDDENDRAGETRISDSTSAAITWTLDDDDAESGCNLIYRTDTAGDAAATIAVSEGNGYLEYWDGSAWSEANAATFSMRHPNTGDRRGNTAYQQRLQLRKATAHASDSVTITVRKASADSDRLLYWGVELYDANNDAHVVQLINSARSGHAFNQAGRDALYDYMDDDVVDQNPDLIIVEIPLANMVLAPGATKTDILNSVQDTIWGNRSGATNSWALKKISNDWTDFQILVVIPHMRQEGYTSASADADVFANVSLRSVYNAVKALILAQGDVALIDLATAFEREIDADPMYLGNYYTALAASSATGTTFLIDALHQNDKGTLVWAKHICPVLHGV